MYGGKEEYEHIGGIEVVEKFKYLGIIIDNSRDIFKTQKEDIRKRTKKFENLTYSVISKCCNRMLMGKTYWKDVALPSALHGASLMNPGRDLIDKLKCIENGVHRKILGAREKQS